ncbi:coiled-coil domain-containing protein 42 homolog [Salvelinus fontinalis]|uniref:coiled-coil domain-containing protein 42 homolog n=1 Tax=Salvelinus fontinalis TaxID=8038 RepID=UPI002485E13B|nr:coiled-coil domain-containing protein 42 homolog [Salvelinus fontinalis]
MALDLEDYFHTVFEEHLLMKVPVRDRGLMSGATRMIEKQREIREVDKQLQTHREEFELKTESLQRRRDEVMTKEEKLKESLLKFDKFLKENDAKRGRGEKKAERERDAVRQKEGEIEKLEEECVVLEAWRLRLQRRVEKTAFYWTFLEQVLRLAKYEDVWELLGRFATLLSTKEQLQQRESEVQEQADGQRGALQRYTDQQSCSILQKNNLLSQLQTELDQIRSNALRWENTWYHIQTTAAKETLLLGQIKVVTLNLYHMMGGTTVQEKGVAIDDTETQLEKIQLFIQDQSAIVNNLKQSPSHATTKANLK